MVTQESLNARKQAAQYIDNRGDLMRELDEIRRLQEQLTPRPSIVSTPMQEATTSQPRKSVAKRLAEQCAAKLAGGVDAQGKLMKPDLVRFLTAMSQAH
jgi:uncharacterized protein YPO0396